MISDSPDWVAPPSTTVPFDRCRMAPGAVRPVEAFPSLTSSTLQPLVAFVEPSVGSEYTKKPPCSSGSVGALQLRLVGACARLRKGAT